MKVLLVAPDESRESFGPKGMFLVEPLALEYVGAKVSENHDVRLLDLRAESEAGLQETLESFQPDVIGCTAYTTEVYQTREIFARAKKILPEVLTVVGGVHATVMPQDFFQEDVDVVALGDGCHTFKEICDCHESKKSFQDIENIYYRKNGPDGEMVLTRRQEHPPLDCLPFPNRSLTSHVRGEYMNYIMFKPTPCAMARASMGCYFNCNFCVVSRMLNRKVYRHSVERLITELDSIEESLILWVDDEFLLDHEYALLLAKEIGKANIKKNYIFLGRSDTILNHPECIEEWAKIGLKSVMVGFEAHRDQDLKKMRKGTTISKNEEVIRILQANNIQIRGNFIIHPDFLKKDFKELGRYVRKLDIDVPSFSVFTPLPGTDLYDEEKDNLITHNYNLFDLFHTVLPTKLSLKNFYKEYLRAYSKAATIRKRFKNFWQIPPGQRMKFFRVLAQFGDKMKNAYRLYQ